MTLFLLGVALAAPDCTTSMRSAVLDAARRAEDAFQQAKPERIQASAAQARELMPCVGTRLLQEEVAELHRLFAYDAFVSRNLEATQAWFEASRAADPGYAIPRSLVPEAHPLRGLFDQAAPVDRPLDPLVMDRGEVWVDGVRAEGAPLNRPSLIQVVSRTGVETVLASDGGAPEGLRAEGPTPEDVTVVRSSVLALGAAGSWTSDDGTSQAYGGPQARIHVPLAGALHVEGVVGLPLTVGFDAPDRRAVYGLPSVHLGVVGRGSGRAVPWAGAAVAFLLDDEGPMVGGAGAVGLDLPVGPVALSPEMRLGWVGMPLVAVGLGVVFGG